MEQAFAARCEQQAACGGQSCCALQQLCVCMSSAMVVCASFVLSESAEVDICADAGLEAPWRDTDSSCSSGADQYKLWQDHSSTYAFDVCIYIFSILHHRRVCSSVCQKKLFCKHWQTLHHIFEFAIVDNRTLVKEPYKIPNFTHFGPRRLLINALRTQSCARR